MHVLWSVNDYKFTAPHTVPYTAPHNVPYTSIRPLRINKNQLKAHVEYLRQLFSPKLLADLFLPAGRWPNDVQKMPK